MNLKKIVELIKSAQDAGPKAPRALPEDPGPKRRGNIPVVSPTPTNTDSRSVSLGNNSIKLMQEEMFKLAELISKQIGIDSKDSFVQNWDQEAFSRNSFSNFMVGSYLQNADVKGKEFDPDPAKTKLKDKNPSNLKNMLIMLDSLRRTGKGISEFKADGIWGERTNNGLLNIISLADSILKICSDLGFKIKSYSDGELSKLKGLVPAHEKDLSILDKLKNATPITNNLKQIGFMFNEYNENVLNSPYNKQYVEGAPLANYNKNKTDFSEDERKMHDALVQNQRDILKNPNAKFHVDLGQGPPFEITAADLLNQQTLDHWANMQSLTMAWRKDPAQWKTVVEQIVKQVRQQVEQKLATTQSPAPKAPQG